MEFGDEDDDWNLTLEELDSLERDAVQKIAQLHSAAASASSSSVNVSIPCSAYNQYSHQFVQSNEAKICNLKPQNPAFQSPQLNPARGSHSRGVCRWFML